MVLDGLEFGRGEDLAVRSVLISRLVAFRLAGDLHILVAGHHLRHVRILAYSDIAAVVDLDTAGLAALGGDKHYTVGGT